MTFIVATPTDDVKVAIDSCVTRLRLNYSAVLPDWTAYD